MSMYLSLYHRWRRFQVTSLLYALIAPALCMVSVPALAWLILQ